VGKAPGGLQLSSDDAMLYVANRDSNDVSVVDTHTNKQMHRIKVGQHPFGLGLSQDGQQLLVVNVYSNSIHVIDTRSNQVMNTLATGNHPYCVTTDRSGRLFVTNTGEDSVSVIDLASQKLIRKIRVPGTPEGIAYDAEHEQVLVASWMDNVIAVIDSQSLTLKKEIKVGSQPRAFGQFTGSLR
jgi:YVTN family beta-propeller protein